MKHFILIFTLLYSILSFAQVTNPDGTSSYSGECALHMDYIDKGFTEGKTIQPYKLLAISGFWEARRAYYSLSKNTIQMMRDTADAHGADKLNIQELMFYYDDVKVFKINLDYYGAPTKELTVLSYGVGGGNGGYAFFEGSSSRSYNLVGLTFDGDVSHCDSRYTFK